MNASAGIRKLYLRMGSFFEHRGNFEDARKWYGRAADVDSPDVEFRVGNLAYRSENYEKASVHLKRAVAGGSGGFEAIKRLALCLELLGDRYQAEDLVRSEAAKEPANEELMMLLNSLQTRNSQLELKQLELEKTDSTQKDKPVKRSGIPEVGKDDPAWLRAEALSARLNERRSDSVWLYTYGTVLEEAGRLSEAAHIFDEASAISSRSWWWYRCGRAYELSGDSQSARVRYGRAIANDQKHESGKWGIGAFHHEAQCWDLAAREFEGSAFDTSSVWRSAGLFYRAGHNYLLALDLDAAERCLRRALSMRPGNAEWTRMLADVLELAGNFTDAAGMLELLAMSEDPTSDKYFSLLWATGRVQREAGHVSVAIDRLRSALQITPKEMLADPDADEPVPDIRGEEPACEALGSAVLFQGSTDRRGHMERARIAQRVHAKDVQEDCLRKASLLSSTNDVELAEAYSDLLVEHGQLEKAAEILLQTQVFWGPYPEKFIWPRKGTYAYQLAAYTEWRDKLPVESDVILYETNLGLSVDCNPLALCRQLLKGDRRYIHVWAVDGEIPVPQDLLASADVLVVRKDSFQYTRLLATAKYLVNNSTFPTYFARRDAQKYLMTWHGTPLKTLAKDMPEALVHLNMARNYLQATHAIFPNEHTRRVLIEGTDVHGLLSAAVRVTGYPRNDALFSPGAAATVPEQGAKILYAPTWREDSELGSQVQEILRVREEILAAGHTPLLRAHHYIEAATIAAEPNISFVPRRIPTNDLLPDVDILITDFSSIYFDYAITGRPTIFYTPDWDRYAQMRGMYFSRDHFPGPTCNTPEELRRALVQPSVDVEARRRFLEEFAPMDDGTASERVCHEFFGDLDAEAVDRATTLGPGEGRGVLVRQSFIPNGMTSSFINLVTTLSARGLSVTVLTDGKAVQEQSARQDTLARLPADVRVVGRVGMQPKTMLQYHASLAASKIVDAPSETLNQVIDGAFMAESRRVLPVDGFSSVIEFDGYSEFMARLVRAIGTSSESTAVYLHNDILDEIQLRMPQLRGVVETLPQFDHVVAVSEGSSQVNAEKLGEKYGIDTSRFTFARNLILPESIRRSAEHPLPCDVTAFTEKCDLLLVQVGRISPEKNHVFTLEVVGALRQQGIDCKLLIVGDGPLRSTIESRIDAIGLEECVRLTGWVDNPYPFIDLADAMMLPSHHEGQPMVILEAQTLGTPVFGSAISSLAAMGEDGPQFLLPLECKQWADRLSDLSRVSDSARTTFDGERYVEQAIGEFADAVDLPIPGL